MTASTETGPRPWKRAVAWLAALGPFFFASYGFATWWTTRRADVGAIVFDWERAIPFMPWTIVPYWTIDLFYAISLFVCTTRQELDAHAKRLLTAQVVAVTCFVLFPLKFTFERPETDGVAATLFGILAQFDQPYNQAPSLHIALLVILWALYSRHARGAWRLAVHAGALLIGVSVLTTWQHHFIDVPTGALLGFFCLWLWPIDAPSPFAGFAFTHDARRRRLALRYAAGAALAAMPAIVFRGTASWTWWLCVALAIVALNYAALGVVGFQKRNGGLSPGALALLLPYVAGAWINSRWWTRRMPGAVQVADDVWLGRVPMRADVIHGGFDAIVDLTAELPVNVAVGGLHYANVPMLDLVAGDTATLTRAAEAIERARGHGRVLVCCALGLSRSASAVAAWLVASGRAATPEAAIARIAVVRPAIVLGDAHKAQLLALVPTPEGSR